MSKASVLTAVMLTLVSVGVGAQQPAAPPPSSPTAPAARPATMKELMLELILPTSDTLFYAELEEPKTGDDWVKYQLHALALAESANVLMTPARARPGPVDE